MRPGMDPRPLLAGLAHSALMALAFPPVGLWPAALAALWPLVWAGLRCGARPARAGLMVFLGTLPFWGWTHNYVIGTSWPGFAPLVLLMSSYAGVFVWLLARSRGAPAWLAVPVLWVGLEVLRGEVVFDGYAWYLVGHPLIDAPGSWLAMPAAVGGQYLVSLLVACLAGFVGHAWASPSGRRTALVGLAATGAAWAGLAAWGDAASREAAGPAGTLRVGIVQTNLPSDNKQGWPIEQQIEDFQRFARLTQEAADAGPALIVWPETMKPGLSLDAQSDQAERQAGIFYQVEDASGPPRRVNSTAFTDALLALQERLGVPMLVGEDSYAGLRFDTREGGGIDLKYDARFNSAFLIVDGAVHPERYDKMHPTPFGERMPGLDRWPWLKRQLEFLGAGRMRLDLSSGASPTVFDVPGAEGKTPVVTPICYEAAVSEVCRRLVYGPGGARRARLMVKLTNDGWFQWSDMAREGHLLVSRWRCLELGTPMARAANTGVSAVIDGRGRILARGVEGDPRGARVDGVLVHDAPLASGASTPFAFAGRLVGWACLWAALPLAAWALARRSGPQAPRRTDGDGVSSR